jgi:hypothetical protein
MIMKKLIGHKYASVGPYFSIQKILNSQIDCFKRNASDHNKAIAKQKGRRKNFRRPS